MKSELSIESPLRKQLIASILLGATLFVTAPSFAQNNPAHSAPVTRAQIQAELRELVNAGYNPRDWWHYPDNVQAAEGIVQQRHEALAQQQRKDTGAAQAGTAEESYGGNAAAKTEAGAPMSDRSMQQHGAMPCSMVPQCDIYRGH